MALRKVRRNLDLLRRQFVPVEIGRLSPQVPKAILPVVSWETFATMIPEQQVGRFRIKKKLMSKGGGLAMGGVFGYDQALFLNDVYITILEEAFFVPEEKPIIWMSDSPAEYYAMYELNGRVKPSRILIGGLGLGILTNIIANRKDITKITVVENSPEVIQMVKPYVPNWINIVQDDFIDYFHTAWLRRKEEYDTIIVDIFSGVREKDEPILTDVQMVAEDYTMDFPETVVLYWKYQRDKEAELAITWIIREGKREERAGVQIPPEYRQKKLEDALWWIEKNYAGKKVTLNPVAVLMENQRTIVPKDEEILVEAMRLAMLNIHVEHPCYTSMYNMSVSSTEGLKARFGSELREMISEAEREKREVGAMLCRGPAGVHLSQACWGRRETVTVSDCHDGLSPLGSFHVHLGGTDIFSAQDLELAIKKEGLSCLGYTKGGHPHLKCITPQRFYELPTYQQQEVRWSLDQARKDVEQANRLFRQSPTNPEAQALSRRAQNALRRVEQLLSPHEVAL